MKQHTRNEFGTQPVYSVYGIAGLAELSMLAGTPLPYDSDVEWHTDDFERAVFQTIVDDANALIQNLMKDYSETYEGYVYDEDCEDDERWIDHTVTLKEFDMSFKALKRNQACLVS